MDRKHALITGGSSGIGPRARPPAGVRRLRHLERRPPRGGPPKRRRRDLEILHPRKPARVHLSADVSDARRAEAAVKACTAELGVPDLVVTSAGIAVPGYFEDLPLDAFERSMAINYFGSLYVVRAALPAMRERKSGRIVLVSSGAGLMGALRLRDLQPDQVRAARPRGGPARRGQGGQYRYLDCLPSRHRDAELVEENKSKPEESKGMMSLVKPWRAQAVADCILRGIKAGKFAITPGTDDHDDEPLAGASCCRCCIGIATALPRACGASARATTSGPPPSSDAHDKAYAPLIAVDGGGQCDSRSTSLPLAPTRKSRSQPLSACSTWSV